MERNLILQGWLTKSPPENKSSGPFKLFKAKWRKRFFVLYEPLASESLPGTRAALDYYSNERYQKKLGTIDLDHCEEVLVKLDASNHKHVFSLRTKHRGRDRTYYLAANTEPDMNKWVDCLCLALGLKENPDNLGPSPQVAQTTIQQPLTQIPQTSPGSIRGVAPRHYTDNSSENSPTCPQHTNGIAPNIVNHVPNRSSSEFDLPREKSEAYIPLVDCYTGEKHSSGMGNKMADHHASVDSIPPEAPPAPPLKTGRKLSEVVGPVVDLSLYDSPTKSYVNLDGNENVYKIPRASCVDGEGIYKIPRGDRLEEDVEGIYKIPRSDEDLYKVPRSNRIISHSEGYGDLSPGDDQGEVIYNVPRGDPVVEDDEGVYKLPRPTTGYGASPHDDEGVYKLPRPTTGYGAAPHDDEGVYKIPPPTRTTPQRDVSVFSQVPLPNIMTGSVMSQRYSPDGEPSPQDDLYDIPTLPPPPRPARNSNSSSDSQTGLLDHSPDGSSGAGDLYDVPKNMTGGHTLSNYGTNTLDKSVDPAELYDAPKSCRKTVSENNLLESVVPAPSKSQPVLGPETAVAENRYQNLPPKEVDDLTFPRSSQRMSHQVASYNRTTSHYINTHPTFDDLYDIPPPQSCMNDSEKIIHSPPPPPPCQTPALHAYVNAPVSSINSMDGTPASPPPSAHSHESFYMPMAVATGDPTLRHCIKPHIPVAETLGDLYTDMQSVKAQELYTNSRLANPSVHDVVPPPSKGGESYICHSSRTRSFKRPLPVSDVVLPTRRTGISDEVTSSDEESTSSGSHHDRSADNIVYKHNYPIPMNTSLAKIGSLNCTPPAPKRHGEVQYLDLALEEPNDSEGAPMSMRTPTLGNRSPTDYREIDFIKTKALNDTQRDVESKRKSSERSVDD